MCDNLEVCCNKPREAEFKYTVSLPFIETCSEKDFQFYLLAGKMQQLHILGCRG
jgi:hypothetical protein